MMNSRDNESYYGPEVNASETDSKRLQLREIGIILITLSVSVLAAFCLYYRCFLEQMERHRRVLNTNFDTSSGQTENRLETVVHFNK